MHTTTIKHAHPNCMAQTVPAAVWRFGKLCVERLACYLFLCVCVLTARRILSVWAFQYEATSRRAVRPDGHVDCSSGGERRQTTRSGYSEGAAETTPTPPSPQIAARRTTLSIGRQDMRLASGARLLHTAPLGPKWPPFMRHVHWRGAAAPSRASAAMQTPRRSTASTAALLAVGTHVASRLWLTRARLRLGGVASLAHACSAAMHACTRALTHVCEHR